MHIAPPGKDCSNEQVASGPATYEDPSRCAGCASLKAVEDRADQRVNRRLSNVRSGVWMPLLRVFGHITVVATRTRRFGAHAEYGQIWMKDEKREETAKICREGGANASGIIRMRWRPKPSSHAVCSKRIGDNRKSLRSRSARMTPWRSPVRPAHQAVIPFPLFLFLNPATEWSIATFNKDELDILLLIQDKGRGRGFSM